MMVKRRRERDRPKNGPESLYDPNKRVQLSYDSDEDDAGELEKASSGDEYEPADVIATIAPNDDQPSEYACEGADAHTMAVSVVPAGPSAELTEAVKSRTPLASADTNHNGDERHSSAGEYAGDPDNAAEDDCERKSFRVPRQDEKKQARMEIPNEDDEYGGYDAEVAKYMQSVRLQREGIPEIMAIAQTADDSREPSDGQCEFEDGAFLSRRGLQVGPADGPADDDTAPQSTFTLRLIEKFERRRAALRRPPTAAEVAQVGDHQPISFPRNNKLARKEWLEVLRSSSPQPEHLRALDKTVVLRLLDLLGERGLLKATNIPAVTSAWIWALLAKLEDVADMCNDDIYPLRQLGKRALYVQLSFVQPEAATSIDELEDSNSLKTQSALPDDLDANHIDKKTTEGGPEKVIAPAADIATEQSPTLLDNTLATIDMIITIVGEVFRQKDLLEFRNQWWSDTS